jgi:hypothetical protein
MKGQQKAEVSLSQQIKTGTIYPPKNSPTSLAPPKKMASQISPFMRKNRNPATPRRFTYFFTFSVSILAKLIIFTVLPNPAPVGKEIFGLFEKNNKKKKQ